MKSKSTHWSLAVAAGKLYSEFEYNRVPCEEAARAMQSSSVKVEFARNLGALYLSATNNLQRMSVLAIAPETFRSFARMAGYEWNPEQAGLLAPRADAYHIDHSYKHPKLGWLTCHMGVEDEVPYVSRVFLGVADITDRMTDEELKDICRDFTMECEREAMDMRIDKAMA